MNADDMWKNIADDFRLSGKVPGLRLAVGSLPEHEDWMDKTTAEYKSDITFNPDNDIVVINCPADNELQLLRLTEEITRMVSNHMGRNVKLEFQAI